MYLAYTYLVRNKITGQFYYGFRCRNIKLKRTPEQDLWVNYFTSSKKIINLIKDYGKDSFETQILLRDIDPNKCYILEQKLISENIKNKLCLNGYCRLTGRFSTAGIVPSEASRLKSSRSQKGRSKPPITEVTREKLSISTKNTFLKNGCSVNTRIKLSQATSKPVYVFGNIYKSMKDAIEELNLTYCMLTHRLKSDKFPDCYYL